MIRVTKVWMKMRFAPIGWRSAWLLAILGAMIGLCLGASGARADALDDTLARFAQDKFPETEKGVEELAASGNATATAGLETLGEGRLVFDPASRKLYFKD